MNGRARVNQQSIITPDFDSKNKSANLREVHRLISKVFNLSELNTFCFGLDIEIENLSGSSKDDKIRELLKYTIRRGRLNDLLQSLREERPEVIWPSIEYLPQNRPFPFIKNIADFRGYAFQFGSIVIVIYVLIPILFVAGIYAISSFEFLRYLSGPTPAPTSFASSESFDYFVAVRDRNTRGAIANARVLIQSPGNAPITNFTDANGHASFRIPERISGEVGTIEVQADNYQLYIQNLTIVTNQLPPEIQLIASVTSTPTSVTALEPTLIPTSTFTPTSTSIPPLVIANFDDLNFESGVASDSNCMIETRTEEPEQGRVAKLSYLLQHSQIYWIKLQGANASPYNWLTFEIRADRSPELPQDMSIELKRANNSEVGTAYISEAVAFPGVSEEWQSVSISLERFIGNGSMSSLTDLSELIIKVEADRSGKQGVIYLDNIRFSTEPGRYTGAGLLIADYENLESPHINNLGGEMGVVSDLNCLIETSQEEAGHGEVLRLQYILAYSQIYWINLNNLDISTYNWLVLDIRADKSPYLPGSVQIELKNKNENGTEEAAEVDITEAVGFSKISEEWQTVRLSLRDFEAVNSLLSLTDMSELIIKVHIEKSGDQGVIYIDNIQFEP